MNITASRLQYLDAIGVQVWEERAEVTVVIEKPAEPEQHAYIAPNESLAQADWFIIKDGSDVQEPEVEHLLSNIRLAGNIPQASSYITQMEMNSTTYQKQVFAEIEQAQPKVVLILGEAVAQSILKSSQGIGELRGCVQQVDAISAQVVVSHSLHDLIAQPLLKRETWADIQLAKSASIRGTH